MKWKPSETLSLLASNWKARTHTNKQTDRNAEWGDSAVMLEGKTEEGAGRIGEMEGGCLPSFKMSLKEK